MKHANGTFGPVRSGTTHEVLTTVVHEKFADAAVPGYWVEFAPDEAELAGAFAESALGAEDAVDSSIDLLALSA